MMHDDGVPRGLSTREAQHDLGHRSESGWFERVVIRRSSRNRECDGCERTIARGELHGASRSYWGHFCMACVTAREEQSA